MCKSVCKFNFCPKSEAISKSSFFGKRKLLRKCHEVIIFNKRNSQGLHGRNDWITTHTHTQPTQWECCWVAFLIIQTEKHESQLHPNIPSSCERWRHSVCVQCVFCFTESVRTIQEALSGKCHLLRCNCVLLPHEGAVAFLKWQKSARVLRGESNVSWSMALSRANLIF